MHAKKLIIALSCFVLFCFAQMTFAAPRLAVDGLYNHGFFAGLMFGYVDPNNDKIHYFNDDGILIPSVSKRIGTRIYAGYSWNDFYAAELGYNWLIHASSGDSNTYLSGLDVLAKFTLPVNIYFSAFAKGGFTYINQDFKNVNSVGATIYRKDNSRVLLTIAGGGEFHVTSQVAVQALITHMFGRSGIDSITIYGVGAQYTF